MIKNVRGLMAVAVVALMGLSGCASYPTAPNAMSHAVNEANPAGVYGEVVGIHPRDRWMKECLELEGRVLEIQRDRGFDLDLSKEGCRGNIPGHDWVIVMLSKSATKGDYVVPFRVPSSEKVAKGDVLKFRMPVSHKDWLNAFIGVARRDSEKDDVCPGFTGPPLHEQVKCNGWEAFRDFLPIIKRDEFWTKTDTDFGYQTAQEEGDRDLERMVFDQLGRKVLCDKGHCKPAL